MPVLITVTYKNGDVETCIVPFNRNKEDHAGCVCDGRFKWVDHATAITHLPSLEPFIRRQLDDDVRGIEQIHFQHTLNDPDRQLNLFLNHVEPS